VQVPLEDFVLTNAGELASHQIEMYREKVRSIGISLLGGNSLSAGPYELGIDSIRAVNEEDVTRSECAS
jgi:NADH dehydrogenase [ubiquinone] 1 alpha subcomplex assembly factor 1